MNELSLWHFLLKIIIYLLLIPPPPSDYQSGQPSFFAKNDSGVVLAFFTYRLEFESPAPRILNIFLQLVRINDHFPTFRSLKFQSGQFRKLLRNYYHGNNYTTLTRFDKKNLVEIVDMFSVLTYACVCVCVYEYTFYWFKS